MVGATKSLFSRLIVARESAPSLLYSLSFSLPLFRFISLFPPRQILVDPKRARRTERMRARARELRLDREHNLSLNPRYIELLYVSSFRKLFKRIRLFSFDDTRPTSLNSRDFPK